MHNTAYHGISGMSGGPRTVSAMRPRQIHSTLGSSQLYVRTREVCHRLSCQSGAELAQLSCWRAEAKPVGASATGAQGHPIDGIRPGRGQPWIMDARCHAMPCMLAGMMLFVPAQHAFALTKPGGLLRVLTYREATAAPTNTTHVLSLCGQRAVASLHGFLNSEAREWPQLHTQ
jgi:hypothetical protein